MKVCAPPTVNADGAGRQAGTQGIVLQHGYRVRPQQVLGAVLVGADWDAARLGAGDGYRVPVGVAAA